MGYNVQDLTARNESVQNPLTRDVETKEVRI